VRADPKEEPFMASAEQEQFALNALGQAAATLAMNKGWRDPPGFWERESHAVGDAFSTFYVVIEVGPQQNRFRYAFEAIARLPLKILCMVPVLYSVDTIWWCVFLRTEKPIDREEHQRLVGEICPHERPDDFFR
jgi:hypothetical protein